MELRQLQIFHTAAQTLNFSHAALALGYVQSNITNQIRQLEEELGVKLFERFGKHLYLTQDGLALQERAAVILQLAEQTRERFHGSAVQGTLRIGAAETLCVHRLPPLLTTYRQRYPGVSLHVHTEHRDGLLDRLRHNQLDVALALTDEITAADILVQPLQQETIIPVISPTHPLAKQPHIEPQFLTGESLLITLPGCGYRSLLLTALHTAGVRLASVMELSSIGAIKECTACSLGFSLLPAVSVQTELEQGRLVTLPWAGLPLTATTFLLRHRDKWLSPPLAAFWQLCVS